MFSVRRSRLQRSKLQQLPPRLVSLGAAPVHVFRVCCVPVRTSCDVCVAKTVLVATSLFSHVLCPRRDPSRSSLLWTLSVLWCSGTNERMPEDLRAALPGADPLSLLFSNGLDDSLHLKPCDGLATVDSVGHPLLKLFTTTPSHQSVSRADGQRANTTLRRDNCSKKPCQCATDGVELPLK